MDWTSGSVFELCGTNYVVLADTNKGGKHYLFLNEMQDEEKVGKDYYIASESNNEVNIIRDVNVVNELLPILQQKLVEVVRKLVE